MKKLLLASDSNFLIKQGLDLLGIPKEQIKMAYISTASNPSSDRSYVTLHKEMMKQGGYDFEDIDVEGKKKEELEKLLNGKKIINVEGGNSFFLLKTARESGFDKIVKDLVERGIIYVGTSAGAYLPCPSIETSTWSEKERERFGVTDFTGLNLVPFIIKAHYKDEQAELYREKVKQSKYPVRLLRDGQGILVEGNAYTFVGEGEEAKI